MATPNTAVTTTTTPTVAFTTPPIYAARLRHLLTLNNFTPLSSPTLTVRHTPSTVSALKPHLSPPSLNLFSAVAFPSRTAIAAFSAAADDVAHPLLSPNGAVFTVAALGKDAELIDDGFVRKLSRDRRRVRILVPPTATPSSLVHALGDGGGRRVLCPVPVVFGLTEPPVVPDFLRELGKSGWAPVRVNAYETRWAGPECAAQVVERIKEGALDAIVFTSTAEVEGLLKSLKEFGLGWESVKKLCPKLLVAAHGPVTASGARNLGVGVDLVSSKFDSFQGVVDSLRSEILKA
ncbi:putative tetrapyrrole biosynthesis, uroporphyrinogen III synthase [Rosa chinensis]|uniref:Putative tetrapyrrole biosynthesis, uroporphyrinogen III synthase n=1 Tax=Rosa chinensis TaxID=74649 RepID=A0A2P6RIE0_ROSCH|nr:uncharacterized protein LOC112188744 [Rosa chinensis]PRQ46195.1 putative tetrapyrrole biosynthesis, uroporphyrinogen III synthase [Rosa chinensis]